MKKIKFEDYLDKIESGELSLDYVLDMDNNADMKVQFMTDKSHIGMLSKGEDQIAAWLPDGNYIYLDTNLDEVAKSIKAEYGINIFGVESMTDLVDYINRHEDWQIEVETIIALNGWINDCADTFGICHDTNGHEVFFNESLVAECM